MDIPDSVLLTWISETVPVELQQSAPQHLGVVRQFVEVRMLEGISPSDIERETREYINLLFRTEERHMRGRMRRKGRTKFIGPSAE